MSRPGCVTSSPRQSGCAARNWAGRSASWPSGAGMSQPGVARFEAGGTTPTLPLLERLAQALGLTLNVSLGPQQRSA